MKTPLLIALAASLAGNVALAVYITRQPKIQAVPESTVSTAATTPTPGKENASTAGTTKAAPSSPAAATGGAARITAKADPKSIVDGLRAAGFSNAILRAVAQNLARDHIPQDPSDVAPYWKREAFDPEIRKKRMALEKERQEFVEEILGDDARHSVSLNPGQKQRQFGSLSDEKIDAIARLERDYSEVRQTAQMNRQNNPEAFQDMMRQQELIEQEKRADLAALLTPEELEQYEMRNSQAANRVMNHARNIEISESEYAALYRAQKSFDDAFPQRMMMGPQGADAMAQRNAAQDAANEQARRILGDDRFYSYLEMSDGNYGQVARFASQQGIAPQTAYQVYQIQREMQNAMMQMGRGSQGNVPMAQRMAEAQSLAAGFEQRLQGLLGAENLEAYKRTGPGRILGSFNRNNARNGGAEPAVRLPGGP